MLQLQRRTNMAFLSRIDTSHLRGKTKVFKRSTNYTVIQSQQVLNFVHRLCPRITIRRYRTVMRISERKYLCGLIESTAACSPLLNKADAIRLMSSIMLEHSINPVAIHTLHGGLTRPGRVATPVTIDPATLKVQRKQR